MFQKIPFQFLLATVLCIGLTIASSFAYGWLDGRWANQPDLQAAASQLDRIPAQLGTWMLVEDRELEPNAQQLLRCYGYANRIYRNSETGDQVTVAVLMGPRGPIAVHTPEICYSGQGVEAEGERQSVSITTNKQNHALWGLTMLSKVDLQPSLEVLYGWSDGGPWQAAEQPRYWMTDRLYKLQIAGPPATEAGGSPTTDFLELFLEQVAPLLSGLSK
ncbi:exosortase-associated EpsI family protein [Aureliella helgolandensis]|uniref:Methanolan biosynthesis EpsI domain-containing protein n=1 Tax=Aureliella helgolandensis TaxID=2527968 RepID=A0A518GE19_9BACT|nr:exosortase-associated EpsI family protein [Aureliella helgolandensis]QDV26810.1 hypothetical protein Q31a_51890 [Aureliella helgolandensis]